MKRGFRGIGTGKFFVVGGLFWALVAFIPVETPGIEEPGPFQLLAGGDNASKQEFIGRGELVGVQSDKGTARVVVFEDARLRRRTDRQLNTYFKEQFPLFYIRDRQEREAGTFKVSDVTIERQTPGGPRAITLFGYFELSAGYSDRTLVAGFRAGSYERERAYRPPLRFAPEPRQTLREIRHAVDGKIMTYVPAVETGGGQAFFPAVDFAVFGQGDDPRADNFNPHFYSRDEAIVPRVHAFYMDKFEVTNAEYRRFCLKAGHPLPPAWKGSFPPGMDDHPVTVASYTDAETYARWSGKRLPTEIEWELAARGGLAALADYSGSNPDSIRGGPPIYPFGNKFDARRCNTLESGHGKTLPVTALTDRSPYGLFGMCGNAREWTSSWYNPYPGHRFADARLIGQQFKVIRGGSYRQNQDSARADARDYGGFPALGEDRSAGFRLVISVVRRS